jgi:hypothetical protein
MYGGFAATWYTLLLIAYIATLPGQTNPPLTALGFLVVIPAIFGGLCGLAATTLSARAKAELDEAWRRGVLNRRAAFTVGVLAGVASQALVAGSWYALHPHRSEVTTVWIGLVATGVILSAAPFLGLWLLRRLIRAAA